MKTKNKTKLIKIGHSQGIIVPKKLIDKYHFDKDTELSFKEMPEGILVTPYNIEFEEDMAIAREIMNRRRDALKALAQ